MFVIEPQSRGFSGRPLIALLFAIGLGTAGYYCGHQLHLSTLATLLITLAVAVLIGGGVTKMHNDPNTGR
jgi:hypothetical protein